MGILQRVKSLVKLNCPSHVYYEMVRVWHAVCGKKTGEPVYPDWQESINDPRCDVALREMMLSYDKGQGENASQYWRILCNKNIAQLVDHGLPSSMRAVARDYFTFIVNRANPQFRFLEAALSAADRRAAWDACAGTKANEFMDQDQARLFDYMTFMMWKYVQTQGLGGILNKIEEPELGAPFSVMVNGRRITQDLLNSILEYDSMRQGVGDFEEVKEVLEVGAGYGRTAFVIRSLHPHVNYTIADIPPALYVSQRYLSEMFKGQNVFRYRKGADIDTASEEWRSARMRFITPAQLQKLSGVKADLFLAVDCLHEMRKDVIDVYFGRAHALASKMYYKCWKETTIPYDKITLREHDYPVRPSWERVYHRSCRIQQTYFEAVYRIV